MPMPHDASVAGIGCVFSHAPLANWKKSSPGLTDVSMFAATTSGAVAGVVVATGDFADSSAVRLQPDKAAVSAMAAASAGRKLEIGFMEFSRQTGRRILTDAASRSMHRK